MLYHSVENRKAFISTYIRGNSVHTLRDVLHTAEKRRLGDSLRAAFNRLQFDRRLFNHVYFYIIPWNGARAL